MKKAKETKLAMHSTSNGDIDTFDDYLDPVTGEHLIPKYEIFCNNYVQHFDPKKAMQAAGYPVDERTEQSMMSAFRRTMYRKDVQTRVRHLIRERADHCGIGPDWVVMKWMEVLDKCMAAEPILDFSGNPTGEYKFDSRGANMALENMAKYFGMFHRPERDAKRVEINVNYGAPKAIGQVIDNVIAGNSERLN
jgi:phage terminase small subunit